MCSSACISWLLAQLLTWASVLCHAFDDALHFILGGLCSFFAFSHVQFELLNNSCGNDSMNCHERRILIQRWGGCTFWNYLIYDPCRLLLNVFAVPMDMHGVELTGNVLGVDCGSFPCVSWPGSHLSLILSVISETHSMRHFSTTWLQIKLSSSACDEPHTESQYHWLLFISVYLATP